MNGIENIIENYATKDLIRMYKSNLKYSENLKKELFLRLDGKKVGKTIISLDNFVK